MHRVVHDMHKGHKDMEGNMDEHKDLARYDFSGMFPGKRIARMWVRPQSGDELFEMDELERDYGLMVAVRHFMEHVFDHLEIDDEEFDGAAVSGMEGHFMLACWNTFQEGLGKASLKNSRRRQ